MGMRVLQALRVVAVLALALIGVYVLEMGWFHWRPRHHWEPGLLPGLWPYVPLAAVLLVQTAVVALMGHVRLWAAALTALAVYAASLVVLAMFDVDPLWTHDPLEGAVALTCGFLVEWPLVWVGLSRYAPARPDARAPRARWRPAALVALVMSLLSAPIIPGFWQVADRLELVGSPSRACTSNVKQISLGLLMYREDYGQLPPVADVAQLQEAVMPYVRNADLFHCPGALDGRYFPLPSRAPSYEIADLSALGKGAVSEAETPVIWDSEPRHNGGWNVGYLDGHVQWVQAGLEQTVEGG